MSTIIIGDKVVQSGDSGYQPQGVNRPTQQQQNQYQQMAQSMADAGIRSLSGRTTDDSEGEKARDIQRDFLADKKGIGGANPVEVFMLSPFVSGLKSDTEGLTETKGDPLKRSIVSNILRGKQPRETGIFGLDTSNLGFSSLSPILGTVEGLKSTDTFFKNLSTKGAKGLSSKDKVTLVNLVNRLGTSPESLENLLQTYADKNEVPADDLFANFNRAYSDISSNVAQSGVAEYFDRIGEIGEFDGSFKTMTGDLSGTRDTEGIITLENVTDNLGTEGLQFLKVNNPQAYYRLRPNDPDLANEPFVSTGDKVADRRFNAKIMEARALANDARSREAENLRSSSPAFTPPAAPTPGTPAPPPTYPGFPGTPTPGLPIPGTPTTPVATNYSNLPTYTQLGIPTFLGDPRFAQFRETLNLFPRV